jgi:hypothetical protein
VVQEKPVKSMMDLKTTIYSFRNIISETDWISNEKRRGYGIKKVPAFMKV